MTAFEQRAAKLSQIGKELTRRKEEIVQTMARNVGMTRQDCEKDLAFISTVLGRIGSTSQHLIDRQPICRDGEEVVLILSYNISNFTSMFLARLLMPGNRVRVRLSSQAPEVARLLEEIWSPVFPEDVRFDFRHAKEFMESSLSEKSVRAIILFASDAAALSYEPAMRASSGKKFLFEGPGNDPYILLEDADYVKAASALVAAKWVYSGQACWSPERIYVHEHIHKEFLKEFVTATQALTVGDPLDPATWVGPVPNELAVRRVKTQVDDAVKKGGRVLAGGNIDGFLIEPTIIDRANPDMIGMRHETFGPLCFIQSFSSTDEVVDLARNDKYGLHFTVWGWRDVGKVVCALAGENYLHEVDDFVFGKFGMLTVNALIPFPERSLKSKGAARPIGLGGYGYSGWVWETTGGRFILKQGPRAFDVETSLPLDAKH
ncbi:MAG: aldehyde dehydrogenase family protein [Syntrophorhabdales bacterium]|jgi:succinate-semialdehyde dehydrogenase/glutarate-semialdehyde dehydrogenase